MADELYRRLVAVERGSLFLGLLAAPKKAGRGGRRPGAGRPKGPEKPPTPIKVKAPPKKHSWRGVCEHEKPKFANGKERKFCFECAPRAPARPRKPYTPKQARAVKCAADGCGAEFLATVPHQSFCGSVCRVRVGNASERHKLAAKARDRGGHRRRVREAGGSYQNFKVADVLARDGWKCRACGIDTPEALRGKWVHNAPELDHVMPVSRGGDHSMENTQCLCRSCNGLKKDRTMAEFMGWLAA